ncbi:Dyp-type peroxidase [Crocosphaera sp. XPORK-15E]|uniref:Dyp-type peroxidase n=1 Tax=Crocosphaera sp. XPORK-15E TaxID=3110247 RepID=UPI002B21409B|nr:Dyp-type peroxidase [Crocosphaera sp. XPORK-15E]MEA5536854.1 Dyp-type peroxidase [Crocosphaera sp. XPORK-15E]
MPLDLTANKGPIDPADSQYQDVLEDLQGNILKGHGRDKSIHIFLTFPNPQENPEKIDALKNWIAQLAINEITSAKKQIDEAKAWRENKTPGETFFHFALSSTGYTKLGSSDSVQPKGANLQNRGPDIQYVEAFQEGMKLRQYALLDPPVSSWDANFRKNIDALLIIADDNPEILNQKSSEIVRSLEPITTHIFVEQGDTVRKAFNGNDPIVVEHFGYADGISQPTFLQEDRTSGSIFSQDAPLSLVLIPDPFGTLEVSFGSFLVFRKLEQNVQGFKKAELALSQALGISFELAGAMAVGRFEDGTPLVLQPNDGSPSLNNFDYRGDSEGLKCPFQAHIRKSNPRLESVREGGPFAQSKEQELGHRIARRGVTYGGPLSDFSEDFDRLPRTGVGLLFMCYQSDIWEQFEFMQRLWCNNDNFLEPAMNNNPNYDKTGLDAVIGQRQGNQADPLIGKAPEPPKNWPASYGLQTVKPDIAPENQFGQFVTLKGGEYFFSPSLTFLKSLSNQPSSEETAQPTPGAYYVVKPGDTLFKIAQTAYGNGNFSEIYEANRDVIGDNPSLLFPGQRLFIPRF